MGSTEAKIVSHKGQPLGAGLQPVGQTSDLSATGTGVVCRPDYLVVGDFADSGETIASYDADNLTFEVADATGFEVNKCVRIGSTGAEKSAVITDVTGTTITIDRTISGIANGDTIYLAPYYSVQRAGEFDEANWYDENIFVYIVPVDIGQIKVIFKNDVQFDAFSPSDFENITLMRVAKVIPDAANTADVLLYCQPD